MVDKTTLDALRGLVDRLASSDRLYGGRRAVLLHGDPHLDNIVRAEHELLFIDCGQLSAGPPELDASKHAFGCRRFPRPLDDWDEFVASYPERLDCDLIEKLVAVRETTAVLWLATLWDDLPETRSELRHRLNTVDGQDIWHKH